MKIRNGFVTNSSSSSFIISVTKKEYEEMKSQEKKITFEDFAKNYILTTLYNKADDDIMDDKSLTDFLLDLYDYNDSIQMLANQESLELYKKFLKEIEDGRILLYFNNVSDCSELYNIITSLSEMPDGPIVEDQYD